MSGCPSNYSHMYSYPKSRRGCNEKLSKASPRNYASHQSPKNPEIFPTILIDGPEDSLYLNSESGRLARTQFSSQQTDSKLLNQQSWTFNEIPKTFGTSIGTHTVHSSDLKTENLPSYSRQPTISEKSKPALRSFGTQIENLVAPRQEAESEEDRKAREKIQKIMDERYSLNPKSPKNPSKSRQSTAGDSRKALADLIR